MCAYSIVHRVLTISAWLNRSFNIANALDSHTVLVVAVNKLVFKLANLIDKNPQFIRNIRDIVVARFTPNRELLLSLVSIPTYALTYPRPERTATSILSLPTISILRITFFSIFTNCESFFERSGPNAPAACLRNA